MVLSGILIQTLVMLLFVFLQSTLLNGIFFGATPDIALLILIFHSYTSGSFKGETTGFVSGIFEDFISLSPIGFNAFIKTILGNLFGLVKGKIFIDPFIFPLILTIIAMFLKGIMAFILGSIFIPAITPNIFTRTFFLEMAFNAALSPLVFLVLKATKVINVKRKDNTL